MENENHINLLGIDPGSKTGVAVLGIDVQDYSITNIESITYFLKRNDTEDFDYKRLNLLADILTDVYSYYKPIGVAMETGFVNPKFPLSVIQLSQYISTMEMTFKRLNPFISIFKYAPMYIKYAVTGKGLADKNDMLEAVLNTKELARHIKTDLMSEHEIDAVCIAYTALKELREYQYTLLAIS